MTSVIHAINLGVIYRPLNPNVNINASQSLLKNAIGYLLNFKKYNLWKT